MAIFGTYLRAGRGSEPVWFRGPKTLPKVTVIYGATSGGPNPKLLMTLEKVCPPPLKTWASFKMSHYSYGEEAEEEELHSDNDDDRDFVIPLIHNHDDIV